MGKNDNDDEDDVDINSRSDNLKNKDYLFLEEIIFGLLKYKNRIKPYELIKLFENDFIDNLFKDN